MEDRGKDGFYKQGARQTKQDLDALEAANCGRQIREKSGETKAPQSMIAVWIPLVPPPGR